MIEFNLNFTNFKNYQTFLFENLALEGVFLKKSLFKEFSHAFKFTIQKNS